MLGAVTQGAAAPAHPIEPVPFAGEDRQLSRRAYPRLLHIVRTLVEAGWGPYLLRARFRRTSQFDLANDAEAAARLRETIESLGPTFVKFGQLLSARRDLLPDVYIEELTKLQDRVPATLDTDGAAIFAHELGRLPSDVFEAFDDLPFAAASMAQVYDAVLPDSTRVVVKVQRAGIAPVISIDLAIMRALARQMERRVPGSRRFSPAALVEEFGSSITAELDFTREGRNADRFRENFRDDPTVMVPRIYWEMTTPRVLTMERSPGHRAAKYVHEAEEAGAGERFAHTLMRVFLTQVFNHRFFHADPHPGNVFLLADGRLCFHDFGIVGELRREDQEHLAELILGVVSRDAAWVANAYIEMGGATSGVDRPAFVSDMDAALQAFYASVGRTSAFGEILRQFLRLGQRHRIQAPRAFLLVAKAFMEVESHTLLLDPGFDIVSALQAHGPMIAQHLLLPRLDVAEKPYASYRKALAARRALEELPAISQQLMQSLRAGTLGVAVRHEQLGGLEDRIERASNRLSFSLIIASIVIGSALLIVFHTGPHWGGVPLLGLAGFVIAGVFGLWWTIAVLHAGRL